MTTPSESPVPASQPTGTPAPIKHNFAALIWAGVLAFSIIALVLFLAWDNLPTFPTSTSGEWEYLVQVQPEIDQTGGLGERGKERWELVAVEGGNMRTYYFKRPASSSNPKTAHVAPIVHHWTGRIPAELTKQPLPTVKGPKSFAALWKQLKQPGDPPVVNFSMVIILATTTTGSHANIVPVLYRGGNLRVRYEMGPQVVGDGAFVIIGVLRKDIKTIDGAPLPFLDSEG